MERLTALNVLLHATEFNLLIHIFQNVLSNLNNAKYQNLNANKINKKLKNCKICIVLLHDAGFELSNNRKRLILDKAKMDNLITIHDKLKALIASNDHKITTNTSPLHTSHENQLSTTSSLQPLYIEKQGINTYEVWSAASKQDAYNYLRSKKVLKELYYVIVETPDGNFGKDRMGYFEETSSKTQLDDNNSINSLNLNKYIKSLNVLNLDINKSSSIQEFISQETVNNESYIVSDTDEEMLLLIEFEGDIELDAITFYSLLSTQENKNDDDLDISPPKLINIYKTENANINFDDIHSMQPDVSIECKSNELNSGQTVKMETESQEIRYLVIYIQSNINDTELTYLNSVMFKGYPTFSMKQ